MTQKALDFAQFLKENEAENMQLREQLASATDKEMILDKMIEYAKTKGFDLTYEDFQSEKEVPDAPDVSAGLHVCRGGRGGFDVTMNNG